MLHTIYTHAMHNSVTVAPAAVRLLMKLHIYMQDGSSAWHLYNGNEAKAKKKKKYMQLETSNIYDIILCYSTNIQTHHYTHTEACTLTMPVCVCVCVWSWKRDKRLTMQVFSHCTMAFGMYARRYCNVCCVVLHTN